MDFAFRREVGLELALTMPLLQWGLVILPPMHWWWVMIPRIVSWIPCLSRFGRSNTTCSKRMSGFDLNTRVMLVKDPSMPQLDIKDCCVNDIRECSGFWIMYVCTFLLCGGLYSLFSFRVSLVQLFVKVHNEKVEFC